MKTQLPEQKTRRAVRGLACKPCEFCGRTKTDSQDRSINFQYLDEHTNQWDSKVYCSKDCRRAWYSINTP